MKLKSMVLNNFKNIKSSKIEFKSNNISGIYGPNGSGKTAIVEALEIVQLYFTVNKYNITESNSNSDTNLSQMLKKEIFRLIKKGEKTLAIELEIEGNKDTFKIELSFTKDALNNIIVSKENILVKDTLKKRQKFKTFISLDNSEPLVYPKLILRNDTKMESNNIISQILLDQGISNQSLLVKFSELNSFIALIYQLLEHNNSKEVKIPLNNALDEFFVKFSVIFEYIRKIFIVTLQDQALSNLFLMKLTIHTKNSHGSAPITLKGEHNPLHIDIAQEVVNNVEQFNKIFKYLIPNSELICKITPLEDSSETLVSLYIKKDNIEINIDNESAGIKKLISIAAALIYCMQDENALIVIDELDAHIFEYLLAEILKNMSEIAKGQLVFTAHNLSVMEVLDSNSIIITSIKDGDVSYNYFKKVSKTANLRQRYLRSQFMWSEDNINPLELNSSSLRASMRNLVESDKYYSIYKRN